MPHKRLDHRLPSKGKTPARTGRRWTMMHHAERSRLERLAKRKISRLKTALKNAMIQHAIATAKHNMRVAASTRDWTVYAESRASFVLMHRGHGARPTPKPFTPDTPRRRAQAKK